MELSNKKIGNGVPSSMLLWRWSILAHLWNFGHSCSHGSFPEDPK